MAVIEPAEVDVESRVRRSVELQLAQRLGERGTARISLDDQDWVYGMVGRVDDRGQEQAERVDRDVPFAPAGLLASVVAARPPFRCSEPGARAREKRNRERSAFQ